MSTRAARLDLHLDAADKERITHAAALRGVPVATLVREAVLRGAEDALAHAPKARETSLAARLRGRATARISPEHIMRMTRDA